MITLERSVKQKVSDLLLQKYDDIVLVILLMFMVAGVTVPLVLGFSALSVRDQEILAKLDVQIVQQDRIMRQHHEAMGDIYWSQGQLGRELEKIRREVWRDCP